MGNQPKKQSITKTQIEMASLKVKIHLELMRDRKNQQIIKGEKQLLMKLHSQSRSKAQEILIMERVVNGLKYNQAVNQLISYAVSLKSMAAYLAQNKGCIEKIQPWLTSLYTLDYASDQLGLSTLNQYKNVSRSLCASNDPLQAQKYINPDIKQFLSPTPTFDEVNLYVNQMCIRNNMLIQEINVAGHKFVKIQSNDFPQPNIPYPQSNPYHQPNPYPNGDNNFKTFGHMDDYPNIPQNPIQPPITPGYPNSPTKYTKNPYENQQPPKVTPFTDKSPTFFTSNEIQPTPQNKPKQFPSYDHIGEDQQKKSTVNMYPQVNPDLYKGPVYKPTNNNNNSQNNNNNNQNNQNNPNSPTISRLMKDLGLK